MLVPPDNFGLVEPGLYRCSKLDPDHFPFLQTLKLKTILLLDAENPPRNLKSFITENDIELINLGGLKVANHNHTGRNNTASQDDEKSLRPVKSNSSGSSVSSARTSASSSPTITARSDGARSDGTRSDESRFLDGLVPGPQLNLQLINLNTTKKNDEWMLIEKNLIKRAFEIVLNRLKYNILVVDSTLTFVSILRRVQKWNFNSIVNEFRIYTGNSAKSNYFAENFLELIEVELISYEVDQMKQFQAGQNQLQLGLGLGLAALAPKENRAQDRSPETYRSGSDGRDISRDLSRDISMSMSRDMSHGSIGSRSHKNSFDDPWYNKEMIDDDDIDDDLLSASPQIPENLLKIVEKKRNNLVELSDDDKLTPGTSPRHSVTSFNNLNITGSPIDTLSNAAKQYLDKRRPSMDSKRPIHNSIFRNSFSYNLPISSYSNRSSFDNNISPLVKRLSRDRKMSRGEDLNEFDEKKLREKYDFKYYKNLNKYTINYANVGLIKLRLPPSNKLPAWFVRGRDFWEENYRSQA